VPGSLRAVSAKPTGRQRDVREAALLINKQGKRLSAESLGLAGARLARRAQVPLVSLHQFRTPAPRTCWSTAPAWWRCSKSSDTKASRPTSRYLHVADPERARAVSKHPLQRLPQRTPHQKGHQPMRPVLDPWIEGYLHYQLTVRRLAPPQPVDVRCTLRRAVLMLEQIRPGVLLWQVSLEDYLHVGQPEAGGRLLPPNRLIKSCRICAGCSITPGGAVVAIGTCWTA